jgi:hypothetical protein
MRSIYDIAINALGKNKVDSFLLDILDDFIGHNKNIPKLKKFEDWISDQKVYRPGHTNLEGYNVYRRKYLRQMTLDDILEKNSTSEVSLVRSFLTYYYHKIHKLEPKKVNLIVRPYLKRSPIDYHIKIVEELNSIKDKNFMELLDSFNKYCKKHKLKSLKL